MRSTAFGRPLHTSVAAAFRTPGHSCHCSVSSLLLPWSHETNEEFDACCVSYFSKPGIDAWEWHIEMVLLWFQNPKSLILLCRPTDGFTSAAHMPETKEKGVPHKEIYP
ncbi:Cytochrome c oxidase subunit 5A, mitochondrial [Galemys pyrenaicus]|uniref:Cytochrome c oxidase subunit 5A, mitochondrial n=1 Tax=Galemys pyrenaicus TaxID=202257 RepID=A0A8J6DT42_GALPY|nr:Cytochrome c oxidase subunit 5A, mitochondrial [Galemys pyrenaicus]